MALAGIDAAINNAARVIALAQFNMLVTVINFPMKNIPSLTGIRGVAALLVLCFHLPIREAFGYVPAIVSQGFFGVDMFFILSGFILFHAHSADFKVPTLPAVKSFAIARFFRVFPLHVATLLAILGFVTCEPEYVAWFRSLPFADDGGGPFFSLAGFFQTLTLTNRIGVRDLGAWNGPTWSLSSEMVGYAAFPFLAFAFMRTRSKWACYGVAATCLSLFCFVMIVRGHMGVLRMVLCFTAGMALGRACHLEDKSPWASGLTTISALGAVILLSLPKLSALSVFAFAGLIYGLSLGPSLVSSALSSGPIMFLGAISFSLYLTHFTIVWIANWLAGGESNATAASLIATVATCFIVAIGANRFIEAPSHAIGREIAKRNKGQALNLDSPFSR